MSDSFVFYRLMYDTGMKLQDPVMRLQYFEAVIQYGLDSTLPDDPVMQALINGAVFSIDRSREISAINSANGKKHTGNQYTTGDKKRKPTREAQKSAVERIGTNGSELEQNGTEDRSIEVRSIEDKKLEENKNKKQIMCNGSLHDIPSFEEFWSSYPNKKDKKKASEKFRKLSPDKKVLAVEGVLRLKKSDQWKKGFIPLPTTYLNGERWEDEVNDRSSRINQIQEYQRQARLEEAREILNHDNNSNVNIQSGTFDRRSEIGGL